MIQWFKNLFRRKKQTYSRAELNADSGAIRVLDEHGNDEDPFLAAIVRRTFETGGMVMGNCDGDTITIIDNKGKTVMPLYPKVISDSEF